MLCTSPLRRPQSSDTQAPHAALWIRPTGWLGGPLAGASSSVQCLVRRWVPHAPSPQEPNGRSGLPRRKAPLQGHSPACETAAEEPSSRSDTPQNFKTKARTEVVLGSSFRIRFALSEQPGIRWGGTSSRRSRRQRRARPAPE